MKFDKDFVEKVANSKTKVHEWVVYDAGGKMSYIPRSQRSFYEQSKIYSNGIYNEIDVEIIDLDKVAEMIGMEYPTDPEEFIKFVNEIAVGLDARIE